MTWFQKSKLRWLLVGSLMGVGFLHPWLWIVSLVGVGAFFYLTTQTVSIKLLVLGSWVAWSVKAALATVWFWSVFPIDWLPFSPDGTQISIILFSWLMVSFTLGLGGVVFGLGVWAMRQVSVFSHPIAPLLLIPMLWVVAEVAGSFFFSVLTLGPGGGLNIVFSFGYLGYLLADHALLLPLAALVGVYGLSAAAVFVVYLWQTLYMKRLATPYVIAVLLVLYGTGFVAQPTMPVTNESVYEVAVIETDLSTAILQKAVDVYRESELRRAVEAALESDAEYIILPEGVGFFDHQRSASVNRSLFDMRYDNPPVIMIDSGDAAAGPHRVEQGFIYNGTQNTMERVQKEYLVPQGEYVPTLFTKLVQLLGGGPSIRWVEERLSFQPGDAPDQSMLASSTPSVLFCFESVNPRSVRSVTADRPHVPFVAHLVSHAWFHDSTILWHQLDQMVRVQARWNEQYIVMAANQAVSKTYDPRGGITVGEVIAAGEVWQVRRVLIPRQ